MTILVAGLCLFLGVHSAAIVLPRWRERAIQRIGAGAWKGLYSLFAAVGFALIVYGFHLARRTPVFLYVPPVWLRHLSWLLMLPVFPLLFAAYLPGHIQARTRHPMLLAVKFWAVAHLLVNGRLADVLLFGGFLLWAGVDRGSLRHRTQVVRTAPARPYNDLLALILGLALYALVIRFAHQWLFGVSPLG